jgi:4-amino-4-deoxychorismate mutase
VKENAVGTADVGTAIGRCRQRLDEIDTAMIAVIAERMRLCAEIAELKRAGNIPMMQPHRLDHVRAKSVKQGRLLGLEGDFVERLIDVITQESCRLEDVIIDDGGSRE